MADGKADYDLVEIDVDPKALVGTAKELSALAHDIADAIDRIQTTLVSLAVGWNGRSQQEAQELSDRWERVMKELFGTNGKPDDGVLNAVAVGVGTASENYSKAEDGVAETFEKFRGRLGDGGGGDPHKAPEDQLDPDKTAITADY